MSEQKFPMAIVSPPAVDLVEENKRLKDALDAATKLITLYTSSYGEIARKLTDILNPHDMPEEVKQACITMILYCREKCRGD